MPLEILCVLCRDPFDEQDGGTYAIRASLAALAARAHISLTGFSPSFDGDTLNGYACRGSLGTVSNTISRFLWSCAQARSFSMDKYSGARAQARLLAIVEAGAYDIIWYEQTQAAAAAHAAGLLRARTPGVLHVLRSHNLEHEVILHRPGGLARLGGPLLRQESKRLRSDELRIVDSVDAVLTVTDEDRVSLMHDAGVSRRHVRHLPIPAASVTRQRPCHGDMTHAVAFIGKCTWGPNLIAAKWIIQCLAPAIENALPTVRVKLVGQGTYELRAMVRSGNVDCEGFVTQLSPKIHSCLCTLAPVRAGGGVNVKVLESLAHGVPVVGTRFASRGVPTDGYLVAETAQDYIARVRDLLTIPGLGSELSTGALKAAANTRDQFAQVLDATLARTPQRSYARTGGAVP